MLLKNINLDILFHAEEIKINYDLKAKRTKLYSLYIIININHHIDYFYFNVYCGYDV